MRWTRRTLLVVIIGSGALYLPNLVVTALRDGPSVCHGQAKAGWIKNSVRLTGGADAGRPYCWLCTRWLRTYGHGPAVEAIESAYDDLAAEFPETDWVYGESGFPWGGRLWPHRTHRNGLSFDLMVPLKDGRRFPAHVFNLFGYDLDFDSRGHGTAGDIDFAAVARHLNLLDKHARAAGGGIGRVIFAPDLQDDLFRAPGGGDLAQRFRFSTRPSWVRHDQHYHVDFEFPCQPA
jgi:penicillin-insensitive murein endopeptidase